MSKTPSAYPQRIDVGEAVALIAGEMVAKGKPAWGSERLVLEDVNDRVLAQDLHAERDQPPFDRVTMDGIAIRHAAFAGGCREFIVAGSQGAGADELTLTDNQCCVEIMTGAALPKNADAVIPVERIERHADRAKLEAGYSPSPGQFVHPRGSDHRRGDLILNAGARIGPPECAALTVTGNSKFEVARWPDIAVVSTGDELADVGEPLAPTQIRASNDRAIVAALQRRGCPAATRKRLPDDPDALRRSIAELHERHELLILSGGVSMGKYDYVPRILSELGMRIVFHKILQRPGLPMWFGMSADDKPVFALPGNPVSSLVCCVRYALPAIANAQGEIARPPQRAALASAVSFAPDLNWFLPVYLSSDSAGQLVATPKPTNTSGDFVGLAGTDGFIALPRGQDDFPAGFVADFYAW